MSNLFQKLALGGAAWEQKSIFRSELLGYSLFSQENASSNIRKGEKVPVTWGQH